MNSLATMGMFQDFVSSGSTTVVSGAGGVIIREDHEPSFKIRVDNVKGYDGENSLRNNKRIEVVLKNQGE